MSVVSATRYGAPSHASAYLDWLQMLSGAFLILFMIFHGIMVSTINFGPRFFDSVAHFLESGILAGLEVPLVAFVFLLHFVLAARKVPFRSEQQVVMAEHARRMNHGDTWLWIVQAVTAMVILAMGGMHIWAVFTTMPVSAEPAASRIQDGRWLAFYLVLLPMVQLHVGVGLYRIGVKWGIVDRTGRAKLKKVVIGFMTVMTLLGLATLTRFSLLTF